MQPPQKQADMLLRGLYIRLTVLIEGQQTCWQTLFLPAVIVSILGNIQLLTFVALNIKSPVQAMANSAKDRSAYNRGNYRRQDPLFYIICSFFRIREGDSP